MVVTWDEVTEINQNGPIVLYEVSYIPFDTFNGQLAAQTLEVMVENMSLVLEDLEEFLGYNVSVRAYTEAGPGPYSEPVSNITLEDGMIHAAAVLYGTCAYDSLMLTIYS